MGGTIDGRRVRGTISPGASGWAFTVSALWIRDAAAFFDTLAQFYRKAYLRWIDATTRRPELRAARIAEVVDLLAAEIKQRPRS